MVPRKKVDLLETNSVISDVRSNTSMATSETTSIYSLATSNTTSFSRMMQS